ncbi:MAG: rhodanese-like domain-containing protein [Planctomycetota bacterium]|jgi:rhodanese-related sulfurtransferase
MEDRLVSKRTILQILVLLALGVGSGAIYNGLRSEGGVELGRQYFSAKVHRLAPEAPRSTGGSESPEAAVDPAASSTDPESTGPESTSPESTNPKVTDPAVPEPGPAGGSGEEAPPEDGLQRMTIADCESMLPERGVAVFVDARKREDYDRGHIPGALHLSHYDSSNLIDGIRDQLEQAFFIIVYCNGGNCEDSINLAFDLISVYGFLHENVYVFEGGMEEWTAAGLAVEVTP